MLGRPAVHGAAGRRPDPPDDGRGARRPVLVRAAGMTSEWLEGSSSAVPTDDATRRRDRRVTSHAEQFDDKYRGGGGLDRNRRPGDCGEARRTRRMAGGRGRRGPAGPSPGSTRRSRSTCSTRPRPAGASRRPAGRPTSSSRATCPQGGWAAGGRAEPRPAGQRGRGAGGRRRPAAARDAHHRGQVLWRPSRALRGARRGDRATAPRPEFLLRPGGLSAVAISMPPGAGPTWSRPT